MVTKRWVRQEAFVAVLALFFLTFYQTPFTTADSIWSNVVGQWIFAHHQIPTQDYWAWTAVGQSWIPQEWGFEVLLYAINHTFGFRGVVLMMTLVSVLTWITVASLLKQQGRAYRLAWATFGAVLSAPWDQIRAETFSYLFFAFTLWLLEHSRQKSRVLFWLLPLELVWVNLHGSYALGIGVVLWMGVVAFIPSFDWGWMQHTRNKKIGWSRLRTACGMALVSLINPQGIHMYVFAYWLSFQTHIAQYIMEWQPATITEWPTLVMFLELGLFTVVRLQYREPVRLSALFWALGTLYMFMKAVRFGSYALITIPWALAPNVPVANRWLVNRRKQLMSLQRVISFGVAIGCAVLGVQAGFKIHGSLEQNAAPVVEPKVVKVVAQIHVHHPTWRVWNDYGVGDALESAGVLVSIDGRTEVYLANGIMKAYMNTMQSGPGTLNWLNKEQIRLVCLQKNAPLSELLSIAPSWKKVYSGQQYLLFERTEAVNV